MKKITKIGFGALSLAILAVGYAATQGTLGPTSTGTVTISLTVPQLVRISGLSDIALGTVNGPFPVAGNTTACIYSNNSGNYAVTVTGNGTASAFTVAGPASYALPYTASWTSNAGTAPLTTNVKLDGQTGASTTSVNCSGVNNATFAVSFAETDIAAAPAGGYTGIATIVISPT